MHGDVAECLPACEERDWSTWRCLNHLWITVGRSKSQYAEVELFQQSRQMLAVKHKPWKSVGLPAPGGIVHHGRSHQGYRLNHIPCAQHWKNLQLWWKNTSRCKYTHNRLIYPYLLSPTLCEAVPLLDCFLGKAGGAVEIYVLGTDASTGRAYIHRPEWYCFAAGWKTSIIENARA